MHFELNWVNIFFEKSFSFSSIMWFWFRNWWLIKGYCCILLVRRFGNFVKWSFSVEYSGIRGWRFVGAIKKVINAKTSQKNHFEDRWIYSKLPLKLPKLFPTKLPFNLIHKTPQKSSHTFDYISVNSSQDKTRRLQVKNFSKTQEERKISKSKRNRNFSSVYFSVYPPVNSSPSIKKSYTKKTHQTSYLDLLMELHHLCCCCFSN